MRKKIIISLYFALFLPIICLASSKEDVYEPMLNKNGIFNYLKKSYSKKQIIQKTDSVIKMTDALNRYKEIKETGIVPETAENKLIKQDIVSNDSSEQLINKVSILLDRANNKIDQLENDKNNVKNDTEPNPKNAYLISDTEFNQQIKQYDFRRYGS